MNCGADDADLRVRFAALREHDETQLAPFKATLARAATRALPYRCRLFWRRAWAGTAVTVALLGLWLIPNPWTQPLEPGVGDQAAQRVPTDGLLAVAYGSSQGLAWNALPTTALGEPAISRYKEDR